VPTGFDAHRWRRPIVLIAAWLVVLQAFLAGVATAQAGALLAADPIAAAAICHGAGGAASADTTAPDADRAWHLCCFSCTSAAAALAPPAAPGIAEWERREASRPLTLAAFSIVLTRGVIRAGPSQAPPILA